ncbi:MAG: hypothetical protein U0441_19295 [Polyangiaceae bacterium]
MDPFAAPMIGRGDPASTRHLLDGAIFSARPPASEGSSAPRKTKPKLTLARWLYRLAGSYRTTEATPRLLLEAADRFAAAGNARLAKWARDKAREETGHDRLAVRDIAALGYDAEELVYHVRPAKSVALVEHFTSTVRAPDGPLDAVGYSYMLERLALTRGPADIAAVRSVLPPGVDATRCLRVHSSLGSDRAHVEETATLVAALPASVRARVARACHAAATVYFTQTPALTEHQLTRMLRPFRRGEGASSPDFTFKET